MYSICGFAEVLSPPKKLGPHIANQQIAKNIWSANRKPQIATFTEGPQM
jgi:hypothetical protein